YVIGWHLSQDTSRDWSDYPRKSLKLVGRLITDRAMKNYHLTSMFRKYLNQSVALSLQEAYELYDILCTDENLKREVGEEYKEYVRVNGNLMKGSVAPDFEMTGVTGEKCRLSDFKGKVLLVDVWATWCAPYVKDCLIWRGGKYLKRTDWIISVAMDNNTNMKNF
ncbi:MAG: TlpA family protein disulfide reductase, partial [Butyricimonas faecihominis]